MSPVCCRPKRSHHSGNRLNFRGALDCRWVGFGDAKLPPALARWLTAHGEEASHVYDLEMHEADDDAIWQYALANEAIIITKDEDFPARAWASQLAPAIVWLRMGNISKRALLQSLAPLLPELLARLEQGERLIEVP